MLSAQDATFIYLESDHCPMHIGGVYLIDARGAPATFGYRSFVSHIRERLQCSRIFRQRLVEVPLSLSHPYWINDPHFRLESHLPRLELPAPGGMQELMQLAAQVFGRTLDRNRPLWELSFIEGLDRVPGLAPGSFALISKVHHAAVDGGSGVELMGALLDLESTPRVIDAADDWRAEKIPATARLIATAYSRMGRKTIELGKVVGEVAAGAIRVYGKRRARRIDPPPRLLSAPPSVLNQPVSSSRTYGGVDFAFERIRKIRHMVPGATVNDVVLAVCAGGLRNYLQQRNALPKKALVAMAPVSVRQEKQKGRMGNQVSAMLVGLATDVADPLQRLLHICRGTQAAKVYASALPANKIAEFIPSETLAAASRLYTRTRLGGRHRPFFNLTITNVPGPAVPLYLAGARITQQFGMAPILDGLGLIIVALSYAGRVSLGLTSCYSVIPDPARLGDCLERALHELEAAVARASDAELRLSDERSGVKAAAPARRAAEPPGEKGKSRRKKGRLQSGSEALERLRGASKALDKAIESLQQRTRK
ncbi:MAG TPA: wax ester/triacylglycerol synthase family O-acyltransferase [Xanthomonadales bacterium]|nr:wax ester/triacylglycerol synthase family O-acyltransferase [Xanthomonadales bacterium]